MKAIVCTKYGSPGDLQLQEVEKPAPRDNEILVKIHAATVTRGDVLLLSLPLLLWIPIRIFGFRRKRIPGHELPGVIESVGNDVELFKKGDQVFGVNYS